MSDPSCLKRICVKKNVMNKAGTKISLNIFEMIILAIICISCISIILLVINYYRPIHGILFGMIFMLFLVVIYGIKVEYKSADLSTWLFLILILALSLRTEPYLTILGGSDEGVYVSMSTHFEKEGSPKSINRIREKLNPEEKAYYDLANMTLAGAPVKGKYEGNYLPGIDVIDYDKSVSVFQFYPLHPLWMSISAKLFGAPYRTYSHLFFALISISAFYLIALKLSQGSHFAASVVAFLLAVNPMHTFFTRFPTSEMVVLAFSSVSFYLLLKYYLAPERSSSSVWYLILSAGAMGCLFFTHIRGFIYIPFYYLLLIATLVFVENRKVKQQLILYCTVVFLIFLLSLWYGYIYAYPYYKAVFNLYLDLNKSNAANKLLYGILGLSCFPIIAVMFKRRIITLSYRLKSIFPIILLIIIGVSILSSIVFSFTHYLDKIGYLNLSGKGIQSLRLSTISFIIHYLSPVGFILIIAFVLTSSKNRPMPYSWLICFLVLIWLMITLGYPGLPDYVRGRYLLVELVPYSLLLIALILQWLREKGAILRWIATTSLVIMAIFSLYFTVFQMHGKIKDAEEMNLDRVGNIADDNDLLLLKIDHSLIGKFVHTPLEYYYGLNIIRTDDIPTAVDKYSRLIINYDMNSVFVLSERNESDHFLNLIDTFSFRVSMYATDVLPKVRINWLDKTMRLYRVDRAKLSIFSGNLGWTTGDTVIKGLNYEIAPSDRYIMLTTMNSHPYCNDLNKLKLHIMANGRKLLFSKKKGNSYYYIVPKDMHTIVQIRVTSATFVPKELGIAEDTRRLGIDIDSIKIVSSI